MALAKSRLGSRLTLRWPWANLLDGAVYAPVNRAGTLRLSSAAPQVTVTTPSCRHPPQTDAGAMRVCSIPRTRWGLRPDWRLWEPRDATRETERASIRSAAGRSGGAARVVFPRASTQPATFLGPVDGDRLDAGVVRCDTERAFPPWNAVVSPRTRVSTHSGLLFCG